MARWTADNNIQLIVDESFVDFSDNGVENTLLRNDILEVFSTICMMKSISKSHGVHRLRLGVSHQLMKALSIRKNVAIYNRNSFAEFYILVYGKYEKDYTRSCDKFRKERAIFGKEFNEISYLRIIPSQANYFLCKLTGDMTSYDLTLRLLTDYNTLIKDCSSKKGFGIDGRQYVRIAIRDRYDNSLLISTLKTI